MRIVALHLSLLCAAAAAHAAPARKPKPLATPAALSQTAWPTFKGDNARTGRALSRLALPIKVKWRVPLESKLYSSPVVVDGKVYLGSSAKRVYCLNLEDGKTLWETPLPDRVWGSCPTVFQGQVFIGAVNGCVYSLDANSGKVLGSYCAESKGFLKSGPDVLSSPLIEGGRLVFGSDNHDIYGWDLGNTLPAWRQVTDGIIHDNSAAFLSGTAYMASRDGKAYAMDLATGALRWSSAEAAKPFNTVPSLDGIRAFFSGGDGIVHALSLADGHELWAFKTGNILMSSPALDGQGGLVFGSGDQCIYALDAVDGKERWKFKTGDGVLSSPVITGGLVWIGSFDHKVYALDLATGKEVWSEALNGGVFTSPACVGNLILAAGRDGELACFEAAYENMSATARPLLHPHLPLAP